MAGIENPIMIVCSGRSGSTMYYRIIARHKDVAWLSTYNQAAPSHTWLSVLSRLYKLRILDKIKDEKWFPKPFSPYLFWERFLPGIHRHDRPLLPEDVPEASIDPLRDTIKRIMGYQSGNRFLFKVTGWARMAFFQRIFPDLRFIYLKRDPKDVVASWVRAGWLNVTGNLDSDDWEWGEVPAEYRQIYDEMGGGAILSAAIKTQLDIDDIRRNLALFPERCYELHYEDLIAEPRKYLRATLDFCELKWDDHFERVLQAARIRNYTSKWKEYVSEEDGRHLVEFYDRANNRQAVGAPA